MENVALQTILTLLPFAILFVGFIVFKMDAIKLSLIVYVVELIIVTVFFKFPFVNSLKATIWGNIALWSGFFVLWAGQVFGQCYRTTGGLKVLTSTLTKVSPSKEGKAAALCSVVGGFLGAFNGFATYPVTIPGLKNLGIDGVKAATGYLVYFSWSIAFVSLFIAANIASAATKLAIESIVQVMGLYTIPLIIVSILGSFKIFGFSLKDKETLKIAIALMLANILAVILFTQILSKLYILTLVAAATFSLIAMLLLRKKTEIAENESNGESNEKFDTKTIVKAFAPLLGVVLLVLLNSYLLKGVATATTLKVALWDYKPQSINWFTTPGFYILVTALLCYLFWITKTSSLGKDIKDASKRSLPALTTLFLGGALVQLMLDTNQLTALGQLMSQWGTGAYTVMLNAITFLAGMCFGQGLPAARLFATMQLPISEILGVSAIFLVGLTTLVTMGPANPLKPSLLKYTSSLAGIKGVDGVMFTIMAKWQLLQLGVIIIMTLLLLLTPLPSSAGI